MLFLKEILKENKNTKRENFSISLRLEIK